MSSETKYDILQNEKYGRYLVANRNLDSGEVIFKDTPFVIGPKPESPPVCLSCYVPVENSVCSRCGWPVCGAQCEAASVHASAECEVFSRAKVRFQPVDDWTAPALQLDCITPLRLLLEKEKDPERWQRQLEMMETHTAARQERPTWAVDQTNIADFLVDYCKLGDRFDKELVQKVCGILEVYAVEIPTQSGTSVRAIYPLLGLAAHNCVPNILHSVMADNEIQVRAAVPIKTGETLYLSYTHVLSPTIVRQEFLMQSKFFKCDCSRCADPTELGTHLSTLKCSKCDNGVILSTDPLDTEAPWKCTDKNCQFTTSGAAISKILAVVQTEIDELDALPPSAAAIEQREAFLNKYKSVFHPHHALLLSVKQTLAQLYGRVAEYSLDELPDLVLERKADFCRALIKVLDVIAPGESRIRGMMLYELHAPVMFLARSEYSAGLIDEEKLKEKLREPIQLLETSSKILMREHPASPEGITGQIAYQSMQQLKASMEAL